MITRNRLTVHVPGTPRPQGSKRAVRNKHTGKIHLIESSEALEPWRNCIAFAALDAMGKAGHSLFIGPVKISIIFGFGRPNGHMGTGKNAGRLKPSAPAYHIQKPDLDKLQRAVLDALKGVVWRDDSQVVVIENAVKAWMPPGKAPCCVITVEEIET